MIRTHLGIALTLIICMILAGTAAAVTIESAGVMISAPGESADIPISLDSIPAGLAGYKMDIAFTTPGIAQITAVTMPEWAALKNIDGTLPAESVTLTAVDLTDSLTTESVGPLLATVTVKGITAGSTALTLQVSELTDDSGNPIQFSLGDTSISVGGTAQEPVQVPATPSPEQTIAETTAVPTTLPVSETPTLVSEPEVTEVPATPEGTPTPEVTPDQSAAENPVPTEVPAPVITPDQVMPLASPTPVPTVIANFTADVTSGAAPMTVSFTDLSEGYPDTFVWDFGDNSSDYSSVVQNPVHTYRIPGIYSVSLTASNREYSNSTQKTNYIVAGNMRMSQRGEKTSMQIFSVPDGAECYLNNVYQGITPVKITNLTPRTYQLRLHKEGYYDVVDPVIANKGVLPTFVSGYEMVPHYAEIGKLVANPPQTGAAYIVTYPELVTAYIDDRKVGQTDIMVMNLAVGTHNLTLVKDGFANWTDTLDVRNGLAVIQTYTYEQPYFPPTKTEEYVDMNSS